MTTKLWYVYILECSDKSLYTGITTDLARRIREHNLGQGSKYVRSRLPANVMYYEERPDRSTASIREYEIKQLSKIEKVYLIHSDNNLLRN